MGDDEKRKELREQALVATDWKKVRAMLLEFAGKRVEHDTTDEEKEELVHEVLADAQVTKLAAWDPLAEPDLENHLRSRLNGEIANWRRKRKRHGTELSPDHDVALHAGGRAPDEDAHARDLVETFASAIAHRFGAKGLAYLQIATDPRADQAKALGLSDMETTRLKRKILLFVTKLRDEMGLPSGEGMYRRPPWSPELRALAEDLEASLPRRSWVDRFFGR